MTAAYQRNITCNQGADYTLVLSLETQDGQPVYGVTDAVFSARPHYGSTRIITMNTFFENSTIFITANDVETKYYIPGRYNYTVEYTDSQSNRLRLLEGILTVRESMVDYGDEPNG